MVDEKRLSEERQTSGPNICLTISRRWLMCHSNRADDWAELQVFRSYRTKKTQLKCKLVVSCSKIIDYTLAQHSTMHICMRRFGKICRNHHERNDVHLRGKADGASPVHVLFSAGAPSAFWRL